MDISRDVKFIKTLTCPSPEDLINTHGDSVYKFCRVLTYCKEDAEDLFQETFLTAFERMAKIGDADSFGFLFKTALFIWKSWKRKHARRNRIAPVCPLDEDTPGHSSLSLSSSLNSEDIVMDKEEIRAVRAHVNALPEKYKVPTILYYTLEMSVSDIAATLNLPKGTIKSRLFKARKLVEKGLVSDGY